MIVDKEYHGVQVENYSIPEHVIKWLDEKIGEGRWFIKGTIGGQTIYFENERDHFFFLMTWGQ
jgi:hypothetical protein